MICIMETILFKKHNCPVWIFAILLKEDIFLLFHIGQLCIYGM